MHSRFIISPNKTAKVLFYQNKKNGWSLLKLRQISLSSINAQQQNVETTGSQPQPNQQKSSGGSGAKVFLFALTGFTLGLGYVYLNPDSRKQITSTVPLASSLFESIDKLFGRDIKKIDNTTLKINKPSSDSIPAPPKPLFEAKIVEKTSESIKEEPVVKVEPKKVEKVVEKTVKKEELVVVAPTPAIKTPSPVKIEDPKLLEDLDHNLDWKDTLKKLEIKEEKIIQEFEYNLSSLEKNIKKNVSEGLVASAKAVQNLQDYRESLRDALDEKSDKDKEVQWKNVTDLFTKQTSSVNEAKLQMSVAKKSLDDLEVMIAEAKKNDLFKSLIALRDGQRGLIEQQKKFSFEENKLKEALIHANVLRTYTNEQKVARAQFLKEIQALQPEGINGKRVSEDQLSTEEVNNLLIHAHKRVSQLQNQVKKIQMTQSQQIQSALDDQRKQYAVLQEQNNESIRQLTRGECSLETDKVLEAEKLKANGEIRKELATQAAAHNNHLAQMLKMQQDELVTAYERKITIERENIRSEFFAKVAATLGKINGIEHAMKARVNLELQSNNASQLWLAVENLGQILMTSTAETDSELAQIKTNIDTIITSAPDNEFVQKLVKSLPQKALDTGIWSEPDLKERFQTVKKVCGRTALIDERGGTLFKYFLSYIQSFFIMNTKIDRTQLDLETSTPKLEEIDLTTFNILSYAEYYVENGQIDLAVKLMRQLKGEPSRLAKDWINDATVLLEIKQACQLLTSYISSIYIGTHLK